MPYSSYSRYLVRLLIILGFGLIGAVLAEASGPTQDSKPSNSPESCATCHVDIVSAWQTGSHAQAYSDPVFQETWQNDGSDPACLACHTTGYEPRTGEYTHEGVTCESCHGETPADHPPAAMSAKPGVEVCADCHATTYAEWQQSKHGEQQLGCTTCHDPHPQQLRFDDAKTLCLNCHNEDARDDYAHLVHADLQCTDCHWHHGTLEDQLAHYTSGALFPTGHTTKVETQACISCHETVSPSALMQEGTQAQEDLGLNSDHPLLEAQVQIEELQTEVDTVRAQGANTSVLRLVQGLVIGAAIGGIVSLAVVRVRRRRSPMTDRKVE